MTDPVLTALLDALLPGDDHATPLSAFSQAGIDSAHLETAARPVLAAMDQGAFMRATIADRVAVLREIERNQPETFRALVAQVLAAYYQAQSVQAALGWRSDPPQPAGHRLSPGDESAWQMLEKVRARGRLWR